MKHKHFLAVALSCIFGFVSCVNDLDVKVIDPNVNTEGNGNAIFNKCYANVAVAGNGGANGDCDIDGLDGGTTGFVRQMFNANELTTDEAICCWGDDGIPAFNFNQWSASHPMLKGFYYRLYFGVTMCNFYLDNFGDNDATMSAEVRFLRAYYYFHLMDCFGNVPFTISSTSVESPEQIKRADLYVWIVNELKEAEQSMAAPRTIKYGRADKAAAWMLLARLYLNAEVYTGTADWQNAETYAKKVLDSGYKLNTTGVGKWSAHQMLFMGDNGESSAKDEAIFVALQDGKDITSWGTTLFLSASTFKPDMIIDEENNIANGTSETWSGNRCRPDMVAKFFGGDASKAPNGTRNEMIAAAGDDRALLWGKDRQLNISNTGEFTHGFSCAKFLNIYSTGAPSHDTQMMDADFFLMRAAEAYLTYAEARVRQNGPSDGEALAKINELRARANADPLGSISLETLCDEWCREFFFEGRRRSDLIRFGKFGGNNDYKWQWKGGTVNGANFSAAFNIFALPNDEIIANSNLTQNPGY